MSIGSALISGASSLLGGIIGNRSQDRANDANAAMQREFAQQGIRWKVADAKAAGIHPLYALGANTNMPSSAYVGSTSMGNAISNMGQDISRAVAATRTADERAATALALENQALSNEFLRAQIQGQQQRNAQQIGPGMPSAVSSPVLPGDVVTRDLVETKPGSVYSARSGDPSAIAGPATPGYQEHDFGWLGKWKLLSDTAGQGLEDMEMAKYVATALGNMPAGARQFFSNLAKNHPMHLAYLYGNAPAWVRRLEQRTNQRLFPFYKGGKLYWVPGKGR